MSRSERVAYEFGDQHYALDQIANLYKNPKLAFKEYPSNSLDNRLDGQTLHIEVLVNKEAGTISIRDDGVGMVYDELVKIPSNIGKSSKREIEDLIGEKGFGILAYPSVGADKCTVTTKSMGSPVSHVANRLRMTYPMERKGAVVEEVRMKDLRFELGHGTVVELEGISRKNMEKYFTVTKIKSLLSEMYSPMLRRDDINVVAEMRVGNEGGKNQPSIVKPIDFKGDLVHSQTQEIDLGDGTGNLDFYLFVKAKGSSEKVRTYNKGVQVLQSITELDELSGLPWASGKLLGEIDTDFLELIPSRDGYKRNEAFDIFVEYVHGISDDLIDEIEKRRTESQKDELTEFTSLWMRNLNDVYQDMLNRSTGWKPSRDGKETRRVGDQEKEPGEKGSGRGKGGSGGEKEPKKEEDEDSGGKERKVRKTRRRLSYGTHFESFEEAGDIGNLGKRSLLDPSFNQIRINIDHPEFENSKRRGEDAHYKYIGFLMGSEVAGGEFQRLCDDGVLDQVEDQHTLVGMVQDLCQGALNLSHLD